MANLCAMEDDVIKKWFFTFALVGFLVACAPPAYFRITGQFIPVRALYVICPPAGVAFADPSDPWNIVLMWITISGGNALTYGGLAALLRLSAGGPR